MSCYLAFTEVSAFRRTLPLRYARVLTKVLFLRRF